MVQEQYVSFETAKLLKEKGFDEKCQKVYLHDGTILWAPCFMEGESFVDYHDIELAAKYDGWIVYTQGNYAFLCPTQSLVMQWLREVHKLYISLFSFDYQFDEYGWMFLIEPLIYTEGIGWCWDSNHVQEKKWSNDIKYDTYEQACESAIKHCLENLI